jgi:hypothetical protein
VTEDQPRAAFAGYVLGCLAKENGDARRATALFRKALALDEGRGGSRAC